MNAEELKNIKDEIKRQLNIILTSSVGSNTHDTEKIVDLFPGMATTDSRPVMHPYGLVSRAPSGILNVNAKHGNHTGNRIILGHRDKNRPSDLAQGEVCLYSASGKKIYVKNGQIQLGSGSAANPVVLGDLLMTMLGSLIDAIVAHTHTCAAPGSPSGAPLNASVFSNIKSNDVESNNMISDTVFTEK